MDPYIKATVMTIHLKNLLPEPNIEGFICNNAVITVYSGVSLLERS